MDDEPLPKKQLLTGRGGSGRKGTTAVGTGGSDSGDSQDHQSGPEHTDSRRRLRALICERSTLIQRGFTAMIDPIAEVVAATDDGVVATELIQRFEPDFVIMDVDLEGMNGLECLRKTKLRAPNQKMVIATDAYHGTKYFHQLIRAGALSICLKSSGSATLLDAIDAVLTNDRYCDPHLLRLVKQTPNSNVPCQLAELEVNVLIRLDLRNKEIAEELDMKLAAVEHCIEIILGKLQQPTRTSAALMAVRFGYVLLPKMPARDATTGMTEEQIQAEKHAKDAIERLHKGGSEDDVE